MNKCPSAFILLKYSYTKMLPAFTRCPPFVLKDYFRFFYVFFTSKSWCRFFLMLLSGLSFLVTITYPTRWSTCYLFAKNSCIPCGNLVANLFLHFSSAAAVVSILILFFFLFLYQATLLFIVMPK